MSQSTTQEELQKEVSEVCKVLEGKVDFSWNGEMVKWSYPDFSPLRKLFAEPMTRALVMLNIARLAGASKECYDNIYNGLVNTIALPRRYFTYVFGINFYTYSRLIYSEASMYLGDRRIGVVPIIPGALGSSTWEGNNKRIELPSYLFMYPPHFVMGTILHEFLHATSYYMSSESIERVIRLARVAGIMKIYDDIVNVMVSGGVRRDDAEKTAMELLMKMYAIFHNILTDAYINTTILAMYGREVPQLVLPISDVRKLSSPSSSSLVDVVVPTILATHLDALKYAKTALRCIYEELNEYAKKYNMPYIPSNESFYQDFYNKIDDLVDEYDSLVDKLVTNEDDWKAMVEGYFYTILGYPRPAPKHFTDLDIKLFNLASTARTVQSYIVTLYEMYFKPLMDASQPDMTLKAARLVDFLDAAFNVSTSTVPICWTATLERRYDVAGLKVKYGDCAEDNISGFIPDEAELFTDTKNIDSFTPDETGAKWAVLASIFASEVLETIFSSLNLPSSVKVESKRGDCGFTTPYCEEFIISGGAKDVATVLAQVSLDKLQAQVQQQWFNYKNSITNLDSEYMKKCTQFIRSKDLCDILPRILNARWQIICPGGGGCSGGTCTCPGGTCTPPPPPPPPPPGGRPPCYPNCPPATAYTEIKPVPVDELIKRIATPPPVPPSAPGGTETRVRWKQE